MAGPQEHVKQYDKYSDLVTKKADADVERFLLEGHEFDKFSEVFLWKAGTIVLLFSVLTYGTLLLSFLGSRKIRWVDWRHHL